MVTDLIGNLILTPITALMGLLPTTSGLGLNTLATTITGSTTWPALGWANAYFPIATAVSALTIIIGFSTIALSIQLGVWVYHQFWGAE